MLRIRRALTMKSNRVLLRSVAGVTFCAAARAQDTASITGTVTDSSGAAVPNARSWSRIGPRHQSRQPPTAAAISFSPRCRSATYDVMVTAGLQEVQGQRRHLGVAEKARVDVALEVGPSAPKYGPRRKCGAGGDPIVGPRRDRNGKEISQLELNGRDFTQLVTWSRRY